MLLSLDSVINLLDAVSICAQEALVDVRLMLLMILIIRTKRRALKLFILIKSHTCELKKDPLVDLVLLWLKARHDFLDRHAPDHLFIFEFIRPDHVPPEEVNRQSLRTSQLDMSNEV